MLLLLSHFLLVAVIVVANSITTFLFGIADNLSPILRYVALILAAGTFFPLMFSPIAFYPEMIIHICDAISFSAKGTRYLWFGIIMTLLYVHSFIVLCIAGSFSLVQPAICLSYISLIFQSKSNCS